MNFEEKANWKQMLFKHHRPKFEPNTLVRIIEENFVTITVVTSAFLSANELNGYDWTYLVKDRPDKFAEKQLSKYD